jgi:zinc transport system substrate-binding protein
MAPATRLLAPVICAFCLISALAGCGRGAPSGGSPAPASGTALRTVACIAPHAYLVRRVGGPRVSVEVLVGPGQSPHTYEPAPRQVAALEEADAYFETGLPFERTLLEKATQARPSLHIVDLREGVELRAIEENEREHDHHEGAHGDEDESIDPHTWTSPRNAIIQARAIASALTELDGEHRAEYEANRDALIADLTALDREIAEALAPLKGQEFIVFHPAFGYFADAYGLRQVPIEVAGKEPTARELASLIETAKQRNVRVIFVQREFPASSAQRVAEAIGGVVSPLDDLGEDYLECLRSMAHAVRDGLGDGGGESALGR